MYRTPLILRGVIAMRFTKIMMLLVVLVILVLVLQSSVFSEKGRCITFPEKGSLTDCQIEGSGVMLPVLSADGNELAMLIGGYCHVLNIETGELRCLKNTKDAYPGFCMGWCSGPDKGKLFTTKWHIPSSVSTFLGSSSYYSFLMVDERGQLLSECVTGFCGMKAWSPDNKREAGTFVEKKAEDVLPDGYLGIKRNDSEEIWKIKDCPSDSSKLPVWVDNNTVYIYGNATLKKVILKERGKVDIEEIRKDRYAPLGSWEKRCLYAGGDGVYLDKEKLFDTLIDTGNEGKDEEIVRMNVRFRGGRLIVYYRDEESTYLRKMDVKGEILAGKKVAGQYALYEYDPVKDYIYLWDVVDRNKIFRTKLEGDEGLEKVFDVNSY